MLIASSLLVVSLAYTALLGYSLSRPRNAVTVYFMLMLAFSMIWDVTYFFELVTPSLESKVAARMVRMLFLPWLSMSWVLMVCRLFNLGAWLPKLFWWIIGTLNVVTLVMVATNSWHDWFLTNWQIHPLGSVGILAYTEGWWYRFYLTYQNVVALFGFALMAAAWPSARGLRRSNLTLLILGFSVPLCMNIMFTSGKSPVQHINLAPFTTVISIAVYAWVVFHNRVLDIVPLARGLLPDIMSDLVLVTDVKGILVDMNMACREALHVAPGQYANDLSAPWREALGMASGMIETRGPGGPSWYEISTLDVKDDRAAIIGSLHVWRDVTLRHQAEMALRESEDQLRVILDNISEAVFIHEPDGRVLYVNKPMLAMYGVENEAQARQYEIFKDYSAPGSDVSLAREALERALCGEKTCIRMWKSRQPVTGKLFDVQVVLQRIMQKGEPLILAAVTDITEHLQREAERVELERAKADARLVSQQKQLLRDMHDGVGGIAANISLLASLGLDEKEPAEKNKILGTIETLAAEGNAEIRRMMNAMERQHYLWTDWLLEVRQYAQAVCAARQMELVSHIEGDPPDEELSLVAGMSLFRVIKETIQNAVKHSGAGRVELRLAFSPSCFEIVIRDDGRGFDTDADGQGRGLKNLCRRMEEMGGSMNLSTCHGARCEFRIPVPIKYPVETLEQQGDSRLKSLS